MQKSDIIEEEIVGNYNLSYDNVVSLFIRYYSDNIEKIQNHENFKEIESAFKMLNDGSAITATQKLYTEENNSGDDTFIIPIAILEKGSREPLVSFKVELGDVAVMHKQNIIKNHPEIINKLIERSDSLCDSGYELICGAMIDPDYYNNIDKFKHENNHHEKPFYVFYQIEKNED